MSKIGECRPTNFKLPPGLFHRHDGSGAPVEVGSLVQLIDDDGLTYKPAISRSWWDWSCVIAYRVVKRVDDARAARARGETHVTVEDE